MAEAETDKGRASYENEQGTIRVNDRRRFDKDGNLRPDEGDKACDEGKAPVEASDQTFVPAAGAEAEASHQELDAARKRIDELARAFQSLSNDREEFKQRLTRERERMIDVEKGKVAMVLLEVIDELDLSLQTSIENSPLAQGVRLIRDGLLAKVQAMGIERLDLIGQPFDPNVAEAADLEMSTEPDDDQKIVSVSRAGYRYNDRVIRPARVKVAKYVKPAEA